MGAVGRAAAAGKGWAEGGLARVRGVVEAGEAGED